MYLCNSKYGVERNGNLTLNTDMMTEEQLFKNVPEHYPICYNDNCELAEECLCRLAARYGELNDNLLQVVNPRKNCGKTCVYHQPKRISRMAYGMTHTFDQVLAKDAPAIRSTLVQHFGNGSYYVRRNGKFPISPAEQEYIHQLFRKYGYADGAQFDEYRDEIEW